MANRVGNGGGSEVRDRPQATTVLVVDDEAAIRKSFSMYLDAAGYAVRTASGGDAGLAAVDDDVDIVLLDRRMSDTPGEAVLEEIRARNLDCQVALVTAVQPDFDIVSIDCDDYLVKPVDREALLETVERLELLLEYDEAQRELSSLRVKRNVLEVEKYPGALDKSEEFTRLEDRIAELEAELDDLEAAFDSQIGYEK